MDSVAPVEVHAQARITRRDGTVEVLDIPAADIILIPAPEDY